MLIGLATLWPLPTLVPADTIPGIRIDFQPADLARNLVLFVPLGVLLARHPITIAMLGGAAFSLAIELMQLWLPGRVSSPWDVAANVCGVWFGSGLARAIRGRRWLDPMLVRRAHVMWSALAGSLLVTTAVLFRPAIPDPPHFAHRNPGFGNLERYSGPIESVWLDGLPLPDGLVAIDDFEARITAPHILSLRGRVGTPPERLSSPFMIGDATGTEVAIVGVRGDDVMYRVSTLGMRLGFDHPFLWWRAALAAVPADAVLDLRAVRGRNSLCLEIASRLRCGLGPHLSDGWQHWLPAGRMGPLSQHLFAGLWLAGLFVPIGFGMRPRIPEVACVTAVLALAWGLPWIGPVESIGLGTFGAIAACLAVGVLLRQALYRRVSSEGPGRGR